MTKGGSEPRDVYLDIAPIFELEWTGIPLVTAQLAERGLRDSRRIWRFLYNNQIIGDDVVSRVIADRSGRWMESKLLGILRHSALPSFASMNRSVAIFPNVKAGRSMFWREALLVHDLSTILMPQFHHEDTILHHANRIRGDLETSDAVICVSRSTADDVQAYFKIPEERIIVALPGVFWPLRTQIEAAKLLEDAEITPFVLVLGTVEPRKNIGLVLDFILSQPNILKNYSFVFVGRDGWLNERHKLERRLAAAGYGLDRMVFTGFVPEAMKLALLCRAAFVIYPSMFEGFGLPVLEAVSVGCPVLCSMSSSLPEVVDESCVLFDPTNADAFAAAFAEMDRMSRTRASGVIDPMKLQSRPDLGWERFTAPIDTWLDELDGRFPN